LQHVGIPNLSDQTGHFRDEIPSLKSTLASLILNRSLVRSRSTKADLIGVGRPLVPAPTWAGRLFCCILHLAKHTRLIAGQVARGSSRPGWRRLADESNPSVGRFSLKSTSDKFILLEPLVTVRVRFAVTGVGRFVLYCPPRYIQRAGRLYLWPSTLNRSGPQETRAVAILPKFSRTPRR
jgi:hypothetical protein